MWLSHPTASQRQRLKHLSGGGTRNEMPHCEVHLWPPPQIRLSPSKQPQLFCPRIFEGFSFFFKKKSRVKNSNWATVGICKLLSCSWKFQTNWAVLQGLDTCPKPSSPTGWTARPTHGGGVFSRQCFPSFQSHGGNQHLFQCQPVFAEKFWWLFDHP